MCFSITHIVPITYGVLCPFYAKFRLGAVRIGDHARIGANSVVLQDVQSSSTVVSVPARVVVKKANAIVDDE